MKIVKQKKKTWGQIPMKLLGDNAIPITSNVTNALFSDTKVHRKAQNGISLSLNQRSC